MMKNFKKAIVGFLVLVAIVFGIVLSFFLKPSFGDGKQILKIRFTNVNKIYSGTVVTLAGKPVGEVIEINDIDKEIVNGHLYCYEVKIGIDSRVDIYDSYKFTMSTSGLLGEQYVIIIPSLNYTKKLQNNDIAYASHSDTFSETFQQVLNLSNKMENAFDQFSGLIQTNQEEIYMTIKSIRQLASNLNDVTQEIRDKNLIEYANNCLEEFTDMAKVIKNFSQSIIDEKIVENFGVIIKETKSLSHKLNDDDMLQNFKDFSNNFNNASQGIEKMVTKMVKEEGSLGKLIFSENLYARIVTVINKAEQLFNNVNRYGFLFQNNREWKRLQADKIKILNEIETIEQFAAYMEIEINQTHDSISRISSAIKNIPDGEQKNLDNEIKALKDIFYKFEDLKEILKFYLAKLEKKDL